MEKISEKGFHCSLLYSCCVRPEQEKRYQQSNINERGSIIQEGTELTATIVILMKGTVGVYLLGVLGKKDFIVV